MGITYIEGVVMGTTRKRTSVNFLVDSGATYTLLPEADWKALELKPKRTVTFTLADGTQIDRDISECHIVLGESGSTLVTRTSIVKSCPPPRSF